MSAVRRSVLPVVGVLLLVSCGQSAVSGPDNRSPESKTLAASAVAWPAELRILGNGFPKAGDPCRRLGESALTADYLDDSAQLVGCPGAATDGATAALVTELGGKVVGATGGVTFVSIPMGDANVGLPREQPVPVIQGE